MRKIILSIFLLLIALIPMVEWFHPGLPITHDGQDHVARIANFYQSLQDGILVPRWAGNLNWGYGHPILMFLYPMPSYLASLFHLFGTSFVDSTKLVFVLSFILSGFTMYFWCREFLTEEAAFAGGLVYMFAPYRFVDLYVRGAIGEDVALIFPPLVLYFLLKIAKNISTKSEHNQGKQSHSASKNIRKDILLGSLSVALLILSHNAISLMFLPIIILYILYLTYITREKIPLLLACCFVILCGFALSAFFWVPAFFEGKYTLRDIVTQGSFAQNFSPWIKFLYGRWSYGGSGEFSVQVGLVQWMSVFFAIPVSIFFYRKKKPYAILAFGTILIFFFTLFLMNGSSKFIWDHVSLIQKFQFPWRFLSVTVFTTGLLAALIIYNLTKKYQTIAIVLLAIGLLLQSKDYWHAKAYQDKPEIFYSGIYYGTTDTGESAPIWSIRFMEHLPKAHIEVIHGKAKIAELKRTSVDHQYLIASPEKVQIRENTLYFPGWIVTVDGKPVSIQYQDAHNRGIMTFWVDSGNHKVDVHLGETKLRQVADTISLISLFILICLAILSTRIKDVRDKS